jgi:DnaJ like chaperone protein
MSWLGAVVGGVCGFVVGGPLGALLGASAGHQISKKRAFDALNSGAGAGTRAQMAFLTATFSVMGHVAKSDGHVNPAHITLANRIMDEMLVTGETRKTCISLFQQGKESLFPLEHVLSVFYSECSQHHVLIYRFLEIQLLTAIADGVLSPDEDQLLQLICRQLNISRFYYERLKLALLAQQRFSYQGYTAQGFRNKNSLAEAYSVLGLKSDASLVEVKRAYRRLMSQNHPDKLEAQGLSDEMMQRAKEKTQKISKAYELIQKSLSPSLH